MGYRERAIAGQNTLADVFGMVDQVFALAGRPGLLDMRSDMDVTLRHRDFAMPEMLIGSDYAIPTRRQRIAPRKKSTHKRPYKGSKAAKRASRRTK